MGIKYECFVDKHMNQYDENMSDKSMYNHRIISGVAVSHELKTKPSSPEVHVDV
jgi:hypothetical protein